VFLDTELLQFRDGQLLSLGLSTTPQGEDIAGVARPGSAGAAAQDAVLQASRWPTRHHARVDARAMRAAWLADALP